MPELDTIAALTAPVTENDLREGLLALGIHHGDTVVVHSALSKIGWVCGRELAVVRALVRGIGIFGLLVMPAHSGDNSEPADWSRPPVPESWQAPIRANMPAYDRRAMPTRGMGRIADCFRTYPGTRRSGHPHVSWCARGFGARWLLRGHVPGKPCFGMGSPLGRLYRRNAKILLLGVGYDNCTALHLAESLDSNTPQMSVGAAVRVWGKRRWMTWTDIEFNSDRFVALGEQYEAEGGPVTHGRLGNANCTVVRVRPLVDFGLAWLQKQANAGEKPLEKPSVSATD